MSDPGAALLQAPSHDYARALAAGGGGPSAAALRWAAHSHHQVGDRGALIDRLLREGADPTEPGSWTSALSIACGCADRTDASLVIQLLQGLCPARDHAAALDCALGVATSHGNDGAVAALVAAGADPLAGSHLERAVGANLVGCALALAQGCKEKTALLSRAERLVAREAPDYAGGESWAPLLLARLVLAIARTASEADLIGGELGDADRSASAWSPRL